MDPMETEKAADIRKDAQSPEADQLHICGFFSDERDTVCWHNTRWHLAMNNCQPRQTPSDAVITRYQHNNVRQATDLTRVEEATDFVP
jgi:hypothetical protein